MASQSNNQMIDSSGPNENDHYDTFVSQLERDLNKGFFV
jgi:hypothetical protein